MLPKPDIFRSYRHDARLRVALDAASMIAFDWDIRLNQVRRFDPSEPSLPTRPDRFSSFEAALEAVHPNDQERFSANVRAALMSEDGRYESEIRVIHPDGEIAWFLERGRVERDADGSPTHLIGVAQDITERKRVEEALIEKERAFTADFDAMTRLRKLGELFVREDEPELVLAEILDAGIGIAGADSGSIQLLDRQSLDLKIVAQRGFGASWTDFWNTASDARGPCRIAFERRERIVVEDIETSPIFIGSPALEIQRAAGVRALQSTPLVSRSGKLLGVLCTFYTSPRQIDERVGRLLDLLALQSADMLERMKMEQALRQSQRDLGRAEEVAQIGWWRLDAKRNAWTMSDECHRIFGAPKGTPLTYESFMSVIHPDDRQHVHARWMAGLRGEPFDVEHRIAVAGEVKWVREKAYLEFDEHGAPRSGFGVTHDITDRKRVEEALRDADQRKDMFIATLAHELRNPLAPIRNAVYMMKKLNCDNCSSNGETGALIKMMERQIDHLVRLVDDLLDVARITSNKIVLQKEQVALDDILRQAIEISEPLIVAGRHKITTAFSDQPLIVDGDGVRLTQIFANILNNAAKYTAPEGRIEIAMRCDGEDALVSVRDDGIGIAADMLPRVFDLFAQSGRALGREQGGIGVGLALVRRLVDMHGGRVEGHSDGIGRGSTFLVWLPLVASARRAERPAIETARSFGGPSLRVLVVDDDQDVADSLVLLLETLGADARVAYGGEAALATIAEFKPRLTFLDIGMPGLDGYETARRIRALPEGVNLILVALTGWGQEDDRRRALEAGFDQHFVKPIKLAAVEQLLASAQLRA